MKNILFITQYHPHHIVLNSPWPILSSGATLSIIVSAVLYFNGIKYGEILLILGIISTTYSIILWFRDVTIEGTYLGHHTKIVQSSLSIGFSLFVLTELIFFFSIFWSYFHSSLAPTVELGSSWPPVSIQGLDPITIPFINTVLLVSSGASITYAHHAIFNKKRNSALYGLILTIILALIFTFIQGVEYTDANFTIADSIYGTVFYFSTGFHGFHVLIGTIFITVGFYRIINYHFTSSHHIGLEASILYWHFVDVVWLFLYIAVYWWGAS